MSNARFTTVAQAAKFLDEKAEGWANRVDLDKLDMLSITECILGQVFGSYLAGREFLGISNNCIKEEILFANKKSEWIEEIKARLAPAKTRQQELEEKITAMQEELEELRNPKISVTLDKAAWSYIHSKLIEVGATCHAYILMKQIGEQS